MIAEARRFETNNPLTLYQNISVQEDRMIGDCANCGEMQVDIFEHDCEHASTEVVAEAIIRKAERIRHEKQHPVELMGSVFTSVGESVWMAFKLIIIATIVALTFIFGMSSG